MATGLSGLMGGSGPHQITVTDRYDITLAAAPGTTISWSIDTISGDSVAALGGGWWPDSNPQPLNPLTGPAGLGVVDPPISGTIVVPEGSLGARMILNAQDMDFNVGQAVAAVTLGSWAPPSTVEPRPAYVWSGDAWVPIGGGGNKGGGVPLGTVVAWTGQESAVPEGWLLCNGQPVPLSSALSSMLSHVPDLRARFVLGSDGGASQGVGNIPPGISGGSPTILVEQMPSHGHALHGALTGETKGVTNTGNDWGVFLPAQSFTYPEAIAHTGGGVDYWPRYYTLAYIIRSELTADDVADLAALDARYAPAAHSHTTLDGVEFGRALVSCNNDGIAVITPNVGGRVRGCVATVEAGPGDAAAYVCQVTYDRAGDAPNYVQIKVVKGGGTNFVGNIDIAWVAWR